MSTLTVALLQLLASDYDLAANGVRGEAACRQAKTMGADIALFPEMWSTGYAFPRRSPSRDLWRAPELWRQGERQLDDEERAAIAALGQQATSVDGPFVGHFRALANELDMAIAITYLEATPAGPRNSVSVIDRHGATVLTYAKVHTCAFDLPEAALVPGDGFPVAALDTAAGPVNVGAMICYDREFPESARVLMLNGAEIILTPNACGLDGWRLAQFSTRAIENAVGVAMANYPAPKNNGQSCAYHPMLFPAGGGEAVDNLVVQAGEGEEIVLARFDLAALREYRRRETFGNAFRRPNRYGAMVDRSVAAPFVRVAPDGRAYDPGSWTAPVG